MCLMLGAWVNSPYKLMGYSDKIYSYDPTIYREKVIGSPTPSLFVYLPCVGLPNLYRLISVKYQMVDHMKNLPPAFFHFFSKFYLA